MTMKYNNNAVMHFIIPNELLPLSNQTAEEAVKGCSKNITPFLVCGFGILKTGR